MTSAQTWWFLATLPPEYEQALAKYYKEIIAAVRESNHLRRSRLDSDSQSLIPLFMSTELKQESLSERSSDDYLWSAQLNFKAWSDTELDELKNLNTSSAHSPLKYWVELTITHNSESSYFCSLSPAELKIITLINPDLGRRVGDELDGQRPT